MFIGRKVQRSDDIVEKPISSVRQCRFFYIEHKALNESFKVNYIYKKLAIKHKQNIYNFQRSLSS